MHGVFEFMLIRCAIITGQIRLSVRIPFHIGLYVGLVSFIVSIKVSYSIGSLVGFFVFLLYVGRLLVLFGYTLCLFPNQRFTKEYILGPGLFFCCLLLSSLWSTVGERTHEHFSGGVLFHGGNFFCSVPGSWGYVFIGSYLFYILILTTGFCNKNHEPLRM